jgi:3-oxoacyl-[acyl-carrier protein] reductase
MDELTNRIALVTGASRGIGRAVAIALAQAGCDVAVNYLAAETEARAVVGAIEAAGRRGIALHADISRADQVNRLVGAVEASLGAVEILVNNAGIARPQPPEAITEADWEAVLRTNLTSAFLASQAVLPGMRARRWGRIIMLSSVAAHTGGVIGPHYAASKAGMIGLMHGYASLLAKEGITANAIAPALIETDMIRDNPKVHPGLLPVGRFGRPEEIGAVAVALAENGYITGQTIQVNGGWYMT